MPSLRQRQEEEIAPKYVPSAPQEWKRRLVMGWAENIDLQR